MRVELGQPSDGNDVDAVVADAVASVPTLDRVTKLHPSSRSRPMTLTVGRHPLVGEGFDRHRNVLGNVEWAKHMSPEVTLG
jgi:hypothetical protein